MKTLACSIATVLALARPYGEAQTYTDTFEDHVNVGGWEYGTFPSAGGNPGAYLRILTFAIPSTATHGESVFTGDFVEKQITSLSMDFSLLEPVSGYVVAGILPITLRLYSAKAHAFLNLVGGISPKDADWKTYQYAIPSDSSSLPPGCIMQDTKTGLYTTSDQQWKEAIENVTSVQYYWSQPGIVSLDSLWDFGSDNASITSLLAYTQAMQNVAIPLWQATGKVALDVARFSHRDVRQHLGEFAPAPAVDGKGLPAPVNRLTTFALGDLAFADQESRGEYSGYDSDQRSATAGVDYRFLPNLAAGVSVTYASGESDVGFASEMEHEGVFLSPYLAWAGEHFSASAAYSHGWADYDQIDRIDPFGETARGKTDGSSDSVLVDAAYAWTSGAWSFGPTLAADYNHVRIDGYTESNLNLGNVIYPDQDFDSFTTTLGLQAQHAWQLTGSWRLTARAHAGYEHEWLEATSDATFQLDGVTSAFGTITQRVDYRLQSYVQIGCGVTASSSNGCEVSADYAASVGDDDFVSHFVSLGLEIGF